MRNLLAFVLAHYACIASVAGASDLLANFDSFPEGPIGFEFTDGGITFSELDVALSNPPFRFIIDDASADPWLHSSASNTLTFAVYAPGPNHGLGRFSSMTVAFDGIGTSASVDVYSWPSVINSDNRLLNLTAFLNDVQVASTSLLLAKTTLVNSYTIHNLAIIYAPAFNKLKVFVTRPDGTPHATTLAFDNFRVTVPEPSAILLGTTAAFGVLLISTRVTLRPRRPLPSGGLFHAR